MGTEDGIPFLTFYFIFFLIFMHELKIVRTMKPRSSSFCYGKCVSKDLFLKV